MSNDLVTRLREALQPFAEKAEYADALELDDSDYVECAPLTAGEYRKAREAISALSQLRLKIVPANPVIFEDDAQ